MKLSTETKLIIEKDNNYLELGIDDLINIDLKNGSVIVATILDINSDSLYVSDDESEETETMTIKFSDIENIIEG